MPRNEGAACWRHVVYWGVDSRGRLTWVRLHCGHRYDYQRPRKHNPDKPTQQVFCPTCKGSDRDQSGRTLTDLEAIAAQDRRRHLRSSLRRATATPADLDMLCEYVELSMAFAATPSELRDPAWHDQQERRRDQLHRLSNHLGLLP